MTHTCFIPKRSQGRGQVGASCHSDDEGFLRNHLLPSDGLKVLFHTRQILREGLHSNSAAAAAFYFLKLMLFFMKILLTSL